MKKILEGKVALVTGATSGIGRASAIALARGGAKVVICGRREKEGKESLKLIQEADGDGIFVKTDVREEKDIKNLIQKTINRKNRNT